MESVNTQAYGPPGAKRKFPFGPNQTAKKGKGLNRQPLQHSDEIVYSDGKKIQIIPSLSCQLKKLKDASVVGLQYVWEYRSPSKSVQPHYLCKMCGVSQLQHHMIDHVKGWKHAVRYLKKVDPEKVPHEEEVIGKNQELKKTIRGFAMELEKTEGRGQLKVILKEPCEVPAFKDLHSAIPTPVPHPVAPMPYGPKVPRGGFRTEGFGGYATQGPADFTMDQFHDGQMTEYGADGYGAGDNGYCPGDNGYGPSGDYVGEYRAGYTERPMMRPLPPRSVGNDNTSDVSETLLGYLDTFKIQNESDAQLVLKVTQKLTDVLMEYRLRRVEGPTVPSVFPPPTPPKSNYNEQYSGYQGLPRYGPTRYYN